jgi:hypothetical protein
MTAQAQTFSKDGAVAACEAGVIAKLISPASYRLIRSSIVGASVEMTYDAANSFGALLRAKAVCHFVPMSDGWHLADQPTIKEAAELPDCRKEYDDEVKAGTLTAYYRDQSVATFCAPRREDDAAFLAILKEDGVLYPVPASATALSAALAANTVGVGQ